MVRIRPPAYQVLPPEHPGLAIGAVGDLRAGLGQPVRGRGVIPVEPLAPRHIGGKIGGVIGPAEPRYRVQVLVPIAPVGERRVPVDTHKAHMRVGPQGIEVEEDVAGSVRGLVAVVFGPVRGVADLRPRAAAHRRNPPPGSATPPRPETSKRPTAAWSPHHLRADQKAVNAARRFSEMSVVPG